MDINKNLSVNNITSNISRHGGNINEEAKRLGFNVNELLDASASLVPFHPTKELKDCLKKAINNTSLRNYPDRHQFELKEAIASFHLVAADMVLAGNGAAELNTWSARDASGIGLSCLPSPGFADYERALKCWGGAYFHAPLKLNWSASKPQSFPLQSQAKVIWITNPHNPTGQLWSRESLEKLLKQHSLVICDEAFLPLVPNGENQSLIPLVRKYQNLIVIRSLTKLFSIAGLRLGYVISTPKRLKQWEECRDPWPVNGLAIAIGIMLMTNHELLNRQINDIQKWVKTEGTWLHSSLKSLPGIIAHPSSTNFQLIQGEECLLELREKLAQRKILLRDCRSFPGLGSKWLRISLQTRSNNQKILQSIRENIK
tara:strand:- start:67000 stop:68115 length:1116 start_codon:yes stop_codon:yes gene_type:complete